MELSLIESNSTLSLADFTQSWLAGQLSDNTSRAYAGDITQFLEFIGHRDLAAITREDIFRYRHWLNEQYKPSTVNRRMTAVRQLFSEAVLHRVIDQSPAEGIRGHKSEGNYSPTKAPTKEQVTALLDSMRGDDMTDVRDLALIYVMASMGLRRDEVARLTVGSITEKQGYTVLQVMGKGSKRRDITIPENTLSAVRKWLNAVSEEKKRIPADTPLFCEIKKNGTWHALKNKPLTPNGIYYILTKRFAAVDIEGCSPHSLRGFFLTYAIQNGASVYDAQLMAGHADPRTTERYIKRMDALDSSAAKYIDF
jgi:site-specific recombinase XerD